MTGSMSTLSVSVYADDTLLASTRDEIETPSAPVRGYKSPAADFGPTITRYKSKMMIVD